MKVNSLAKLALSAALLSFSTFSASAYQIKHGYSVTDGMEYYGVCDNGKELQVVENFKAGISTYSGPSGKGKVKGSMDEAARKACGESKAKDKKAK